MTLDPWSEQGKDWKCKAMDPSTLSLCGASSWPSCSSSCCLSRAATAWRSTDAGDPSRKRRHPWGPWSGRPWVCWPSCLRSPLGPRLIASIRGDKCFSMRPTRSGRPICEQGCFRSGARKFAPSCATTWTLVCKRFKSNKIAEGIRRSEQLQDQLWAHAVVLGESNPASIVVGLFVAVAQRGDRHPHQACDRRREESHSGRHLACASCGRRDCSRRHGISRRPLRERADRSRKLPSLLHFPWSSGSLRISTDRKRGPLR